MRGEHEAIAREQQPAAMAGHGRGDDSLAARPTVRVHHVHSAHGEHLDGGQVDARVGDDPSGARARVVHGDRGCVVHRWRGRDVLSVVGRRLLLRRGGLPAQASHREHETQRDFAAGHHTPLPAGVRGRHRALIVGSDSECSE